TRAIARFRECGKVGVIFHRDWRINEIFEPTPKVQIFPTIHLMGTTNPSRPPIHRAPETDASGSPADAGPLFQRDFDLLANSRRSPCSFSKQTLAEQDVSRGRSSDQLQFRAANLQA